MEDAQSPPDAKSQNAEQAHLDVPPPEEQGVVAHADEAVPGVETAPGDGQAVAVADAADPAAPDPAQSLDAIIDSFPAEPRSQGDEPMALEAQADPSFLAASRFALLSRGGDSAGLAGDQQPPPATPDRFQVSAIFAGLGPAEPHSEPSEPAPEPHPAPEAVPAHDAGGLLLPPEYPAGAFGLRGRLFTQPVDAPMPDPSQGTTAHPHPADDGRAPLDQPHGAPASQVAALDSSQWPPLPAVYDPDQDLGPEANTQANTQASAHGPDADDDAGPDPAQIPPLPDPSSWTPLPGSDEAAATDAEPVMEDQSEPVPAGSAAAPFPEPAGWPPFPELPGAEADPASQPPPLEPPALAREAAAGLSRSPFPPPPDLAAIHGAARRGLRGHAGRAVRPAALHRASGR